MNKKLDPTVIQSINRLVNPMPKRKLSAQEVEEEAERIGKKIKWNVSSTDDDTKDKPLPDLIAKKAKVISDHIIKDIEDALDRIFADPTTDIQYPRSENKLRSYEFKEENKFYEFKPDKEEFKPLKDHILETKFRSVNTPKHPENNGLEFSFVLKTKLKTDSVAYGELITKLRGIGDIYAKSKDGVYTITFSSKESIKNVLEELKDLKSETHKDFLASVLKGLEGQITVKEIWKQVQENTKEDVEEEKRQFIANDENIKMILGVNHLKGNFAQRLDKIFNNKRAIKEQIERLGMLRKLILSEKFDELLEEMIIKYTAKASTKEISNVLAVIADAVGVRSSDLQGFINQKLEEFDKTGTEPLIARTERIVSATVNLSVIKEVVINGINKQIEDQEKAIGKNLVMQEELIKTFNKLTEDLKAGRMHTIK